MKPKVIVSSLIKDEIFEKLNDVAEVSFKSFGRPDALPRDLGDAVALVAVGEKINEELLKHTPKLKVVARYGVGYDTVDVEACTKRGVYVTHTPAVLSDAVAELTFGLMLSLSRNLVNADHIVRTEWTKSSGNPMNYGVDLVGKTLGIIGLGRIGYEVARRAKTFGMNLVYYDSVRREDVENELGIKYLKLDELLRNSDFVTIHTPLTANTTSLIGESQLRLMKRTAYLINTSRGPTVDEEALCRALLESWIAGAGLDVFEKEPLPFESPLIKMKNVILTPHIGSYTLETRRAMALSCIENVRKVLLGKVPQNPVPEQKGNVFKK